MHTQYGYISGKPLLGQWNKTKYIVVKKSSYLWYYFIIELKIDTVLFIMAICTKMKNYIN